MRYHRINEYTNWLAVSLAVTGVFGGIFVLMGLPKAYEWILIMLFVIGLIAVSVLVIELITSMLYLAERYLNTKNSQLIQELKKEIAILKSERDKGNL